MTRPVHITRAPDDSLALRASIGGIPELGWYLVYRGNPNEILMMLEEVLVAARRELSTTESPAETHESTAHKHVEGH